MMSQVQRRSSAAKKAARVRRRQKVAREAAQVSDPHGNAQRDYIASLRQHPPSSARPPNGKGAILLTSVVCAVLFVVYFGFWFGSA